MNFSPVLPRVAKIRERYRSTQPKLCTARIRIVTDFYKENAQLTGILKRAYSFKNMCEKLPVRVFEDEVIAGNLASTYRGSTLFPENALHWFKDDYDRGLVPNRTLDPYIIDEEDIEYILSVVDFWDKESLSAKSDAYIPEGYLKSVGNGVTVFSDKYNSTTPVGHFVPNYTKAMKLGFRAIREEALAKMQELEGRMFCCDVEKYNFYRAVAVSCEGLITFSKRFGAECARQASECTDTRRKAELEEMAEVFDWIIENPCRTFHEALQCMYTYHLALCLDANMHGLSFGRVDRYLGEFYENDIKSGRITPERAQELMDLFFLKIAELNKFWATDLTHAIAGYTSGCLMTLGGTDKNGKDATNDVTYMMLQSAARLILHDPPLALRIHEGTPEKLWKMAIETTKLCGGVPTFQNDGVIIPSLIGRGMSREDAYDYCIVGCVEPAGTGNSWPACCGTGAEGYWNMANAVVLALNNGINPFDTSAAPRQTGLATGYLYEMTDFDAVKEAVRKQFEFFINWQVSLTNSFEYIAGQCMCQPLASATIDGCMESGKDVMWGGAKYNSTGFPGVGIGTVCDSLTAIKYLCFDKKLCTTRELYDALISNWQGREELRQKILNEVPHYGNADPYVDAQAEWVSDMFSELITKAAGPRGHYTAGLYPITFHVVYGKTTAATPDGRMSGEPLSDGISPVQSLDKNGPEAILLSSSRINQEKYSDGTLLNMKFHPNTLNTNESIDKLIALIKTYFSMGGMQLQFNVISADTLRKAQEHPEDYKDLVVRIAGFSAYFVEVYKECQDDIIKRTELSI